MWFEGHRAEYGSESDDSSDSLTVFTHPGGPLGELDIEPAERGGAHICSTIASRVRTRLRSSRWLQGSGIYILGCILPIILCILCLLCRRPPRKATRGGGNTGSFGRRHTDTGRDGGLDGREPSNVCCEEETLLQRDRTFNDETDATQKIF